MDIQKFIRAIQIPFILELANLIIFSILVRYAFEGVGILSWAVPSIAFTIAILFYLGWRVATIYEERRFLKAAGLGLFFLFLFLVISVVFDFFYSFVVSEPNYSALNGSLIGFILFSPVAATVPMVGTFIRTRFRKRPEPNQ